MTIKEKLKNLLKDLNDKDKFEEIRKSKKVKIILTGLAVIGYLYVGLVLIVALKVTTAPLFMDNSELDFYFASLFHNTHYNLKAIVTLFWLLGALTIVFLLLLAITIYLPAKALWDYLRSRGRAIE